MIYKDVFIDIECTYYPEIRQNSAKVYITGRMPCVAFLPDIERCFDSVENAKKFIDKNIKRIRKKCDEHSKKHGLPF